MKKVLYYCLGSLVLAQLSVGPLAAADLPELLQKRGDECLKAILNGEPTNYYSENAGVYLDTSFLINADTFLPMIRELHLKLDIERRKPITYIPHNEHRGMEVGYLVNSNNKEKILYATGWSMKDAVWTKDFEFLKPLSQDLKFEDVFERSRSRWVTLCNLHNPAALTSEMYLEDAIYFSYGEMTVGPENIAKRYAYMSSPDYNLNLRADFTITFDDFRGMEVGKYINERNEGVYIILWKKIDDNWRIILDFNF